MSPATGRRPRSLLDASIALLCALGALASPAVAQDDPRDGARPALDPSALVDAPSRERIPGTFVLFLRLAPSAELQRLDVALYDADGQRARAATWEPFLLERLADRERIAFGLFRSGEYRLVVAANGTEVTRVRFLAEEADVVLDVPDGKTPTTALTVSVVDASGAAVRDALVGVGDDVVTTNEDGRALLTLNRGATRIEATCEGYGATADFVELDDDVAHARIRMRALPSGRLRFVLEGERRDVRSIDSLLLVSVATGASLEVGIVDGAAPDWVELGAGDWRVAGVFDAVLEPSVVRVRPNEDFTATIDVSRPRAGAVHRSVVVETNGGTDERVVWRGASADDVELERFARPGMRHTKHTVIDVADTPRIRVPSGQRVRVLGSTIRGMPLPGVLRDRAREGCFWLTDAFEGWWMLRIGDADVLVRVTPGMDVAIELPAERCALDFEGTAFQPTELSVVQRIAPDLDALLVSRPACNREGVWEIPLGAGPLLFRARVGRSVAHWIEGDVPAPDHLARIEAELVGTTVDLGRHVPRVTIGLTGEAASDFTRALGASNAILYRGPTTEDGRVVVLARRGTPLTAWAELGTELRSAAGVVTGDSLSLSFER